MSLKNIQLPAIVIAQLYKNSLVDVRLEKSNPTLKKPEIKFLGGNSRYILILIAEDKAAIISESKLTFLTGILSACRLSIGDVAIVNLHSMPIDNYKNIISLLQPEVVILFGIKNSALDLPFKVPDFQVQHFKSTKYLFTPDLQLIQNTTQLKRDLWEALKKLFSL